MRLLISSGEASGELYGAQLIEALRRREPALETFGVGGERMQAAGCRLVVHARDVAVVGLGEVVSHLPRIYREFHKLLRALDETRPDAAVLIDFPDFNFRLAKQLHRRGIPVVYYVSPQLWAWRESRIELVRKYVRKMLVIFPFEEAWYRERGVEAEYVGHPLADLAASPLPPSFRAGKSYEEDRFEGWIALLPGSRRKEVQMNLPIMRAAAARLYGPEMEREYVVPVASTLDQSWVKNLALGGPFLPIYFVDDARFALANARAAVVASGTATVEAALIGTPFVMVYRVSPLTWMLGRRLVKVPFFAMPNLIAGREVVPELVQSNFTATNVVAKLKPLLEDGPERATMLAGLAEVREKLKPPAGDERSAAERAAGAVLRALSR